MNKARRKQLEEIVNNLDEQKSAIESVCEEEQEAFDNLPESIQYSERGETMESYISEMEDALSNLEDIISSLQEIIDA